MTATDSSVGNSYDAVVVGGGPAGSTVATLLAQHGLRVAIFERARFPRFHIGESLLPANVPIFERLGCHDALRRAGFLVKPGASFYDEYEGRGTNTFAFQVNTFQPAFAYNVVRASFDDILLQHAASAGCTVHRQHTVGHATDGAGQSSGRCERTLSATWRHVRAARTAARPGESSALRPFSGRPARSDDSRWQYSHPPRARRL